MPLYPEYSTGAGQPRGVGPASSLSGAALSPESRVLLQAGPAQPGPTQGQPGVRPYYGPEEVTRSRYRDLDPEQEQLPAQHRRVKIDLLNE